MSVAFRNVYVEPGTPADKWPFEAIVTVIERGTLTDWLILTRAIDEDPWGPVARQVEEYLGYASPRTRSRGRARVISPVSTHQSAFAMTECRPPTRHAGSPGQPGERLRPSHRAYASPRGCRLFNNARSGVT